MRIRGAVFVRRDFLDKRNLRATKERLAIAIAKNAIFVSRLARFNYNMYGQWSILMSISATTVKGSIMVKYISTTIAVIVIGCSKVLRDYRAT